MTSNAEPEPEPELDSWQRKQLEEKNELERQEAQRIGSPFKVPSWDFLGGVGPIPRCLDEWLIFDISYSIRSKPNWRSKYKNEEIVKKWNKEIREQCQDKTKYMDQIIEYVFKELEWYDRVEKDLGTFRVGYEEKILLSDSAVSESLKKDFTTEVEKLVDSFDGNFDFHPGSNQAVVDLVHPSLFVVQYDKTPVLLEGQLEIARYHEKIENAKANVGSYMVSKNFQWIPSLLSKNSSGQFVFNSYINNLHPVKFKQLYDSIGKIFNAAIPGLNCCLSRYASKEYIRIPIPICEDAYVEGYDEEFYEFQEQLEKEAKATGVPVDYSKYGKIYEKQVLYLREFIPKWESDPVFDKPIDLTSFDNLKVIVKLANIELTPERPSYPGGSWHVEGSINEDIVATVLYYYDIENISESKLSFRTGVDEPAYVQHDYVYTEVIFGIHDEDHMIRELGNVEAKEDRVVVFPNLFEHHVEPFELKDKSKPGHRKILCFFIVDPYNNNVLSTKQVPPQNEEWWDDSSLDYLFPNNLKEQIRKLKKGGDSSWPITLDEAKKVREKFMEERSVMISVEPEFGGGAFDRLFCFCEH